MPRLIEPRSRSSAKRVRIFMPSPLDGWGAGCDFPRERYPNFQSALTGQSENYDAEELAIPAAFSAQDIRQGKVLQSIYRSSQNG